ncbi:transcription repressor OFP17-like [Cynara cardunculus var. scolymus]|uniref:OVATE domain-containing protein n=1 Tax=Cynara cardunculus var. scolymus TaxID=59895 RepID=A0A118K6Y4_CYNCS|nr:transcription repressor OFP17-like [Cynara cardunculus var. scolymus]KVI11373.1 hypothetical protein Ccrd_010216 [Cynara cardunculus var. scolymus]
MTTKPLLSFTCKKLFTNPCKNFIHLFKFKLRKPIFKRSRRSRKSKTTTTSSNRHHFSGLTSLFRSSRKTRDMDRVMELKSFSEAGKEPCPSPLTPAYIKMRRVDDMENMQVQEDEDVAEHACQSFENYLVKMIAEEGKMRDLVDVEELLYCWKNLKSPLFINLVCRFYGELCHDLFPSKVDEDDHDEARSLM